MTTDDHPEAAPAQLLRAAAFAAHKHRDQRRKGADASPYINHPISVANVLASQGGITDVDVLCAAILHDTVEDTATTFEELELEFGKRIAGIVREVTDDKILDKPVRKQLQIEHAPHLSQEAKCVKLADKICNLQDILGSPPNWPIERKQEYFDWAAAVVSGLRGANAVLAETFDALMRRRAELVGSARS